MTYTLCIIAASGRIWPTLSCTSDRKFKHWSRFQTLKIQSMRETVVKVYAVLWWASVIPIKLHATASFVATVFVVVCSRNGTHCVMVDDKRCWEVHNRLLPHCWQAAFSLIRTTPKGLFLGNERISEVSEWSVANASRLISSKFSHQQSSKAAMR